MANDPPFATLNHFAGDLRIPNESQSIRGLVLEIRDIDAFRTKISSIRNALIILQSDGGSLLAGIEIGRIIRMRNYATIVPNGVRCASACALAWLGGTRRYLGVNARIGFHAAYVFRAGEPVESGVGNALLGSYLGQLGLSDEAIVYITRSSPTTMTWLDIDEAKQKGIEVFRYNEAIQHDGAAVASAPSQLVASNAIEFADLLRVFMVPESDDLATVSDWRAGSENETKIRWEHAGLRDCPQYYQREYGLPFCRTGSVILSIEGKPTHEFLGVAIEAGRWEIVLMGARAGVFAVRLSPQILGGGKFLEEAARGDLARGGSMQISRLQTCGKSVVAPVIYGVSNLKKKKAFVQESLSCGSAGCTSTLLLTLSKDDAQKYFVRNCRLHQP